MKREIRLQLYNARTSLQASSPQLSQKDIGAVTSSTGEVGGGGGGEEGPEKENEAKKPAVVSVGGTDVPLREKILKKSVSNQSTDGKTQGLSMFDNRAKVRPFIQGNDGIVKRHKHFRINT